MMCRAARRSDQLWRAADISPCHDQLLGDNMLPGRRAARSRHAANVPPGHGVFLRAHYRVHRCRAACCPDTTYYPSTTTRAAPPPLSTAAATSRALACRPTTTTIYRAMTCHPATASRPDTTSHRATTSRRATRSHGVPPDQNMSSVAAPRRLCKRHPAVVNVLPDHDDKAPGKDQSPWPR